MRIYILMIKANKLFFFVVKFCKRNRKLVLHDCFYILKHLWKFGRTRESCRNTPCWPLFTQHCLVLPNSHSCFLNLIETLGTCFPSLNELQQVSQWKSHYIRCLLNFESKTLYFLWYRYIVIILSLQKVVVPFKTQSSWIRVNILQLNPFYLNIQIKLPCEPFSLIKLLLVKQPGKPLTWKTDYVKS